MGIKGSFWKPVSKIAKEKKTSLAPNFTTFGKTNSDKPNFNEYINIDMYSKRAVQI